MRTLLFLLLAFMCDTMIAQQKTNHEPASTDVEKVEEYFEQLFEQFNEGKVTEVIKHFDGDKLVKNAESRALIQHELSESERVPLVTLIDNSFEPIFKKWALSVPWSTASVAEVKDVGNGVFAVITRHWNDDNGSYSRIRWWLDTNPKQWVISDFSYMLHPVRYSALFALASDAVLDDPAWPKIVSELAANVMKAGDAATAIVVKENMVDRVNEALELELPDELRFFVLYLKGVNQINVMRDPEASLSTCEKMEELNPDSPAYLSLNAYRCELAGQPSMAFQSYRRIADRFGWEADLCQSVSSMHYTTNNRTKAAEFAILGLADQATSIGCLTLLALSLPANEKDKLDKHFDNVDHSLDSMVKVFNEVLFSRDLPAARHLISLMRRYHPGNSSVSDCQARLDKHDN